MRVSMRRTAGGRVCGSRIIGSGERGRIETGFAPDARGRIDRCARFDYLFRAVFSTTSRGEAEKMGKGDKKSFRGKLFKGSHGKTRPGRSGKKKAVFVPAPVPAAPVRPAGRRRPAA